MDGNISRRGSLAPWRGWLARALLLAIAVNAPFAAVQYYQGEHSPLALNDADEVVYLQQALRMAEGRPQFSFYYEHDPLTNPTARRPVLQLLSSYPNAALDWAAGKLGQWLGLRPMQFGMLIDVLAVGASYFAFTGFFALFASRAAMAEICAAVFLCFPWIFTINWYFRIPFDFFESIVYPQYIYHIGPPVMRGIATQLSYPILAWALWCAGRSVLRKGRAIGLLAASAALCGLLGYVYFFAWVAAAFLCLTLIAAGVLAALLSHEKGVYRQGGRALLVFCAVFTAVSLPAAMMMKAYGSETFRHPEISQYWFFSLEALALGLALLLPIRRIAGRAELFYPVFLAACCAFGEIFLMNLQPLVGSAISPNRFVELYLQPLGGAMLLLSAMNLFAKRKAVLRAVGTAVAAAIFAQGVARTAPAWAASQRSFIDYEQFIEYLVEKTEPDAVVAIMSIAYPFAPSWPATVSFSHLPNLTATLSERHILFQDWISGPELSQEEKLRRELFLGFLFSGEMQLTWRCMKQVPDLPGDLFAVVWSYHKLQRVRDCSRYRELLETYSPCQANRDFKVDYIAWESRYALEKPEWFSELAEPVWQGPQGRWELYRYDQPAAIEKFCEDSNKSARPENGASRDEGSIVTGGSDSDGRDDEETVEQTD